MVKLTNRQREGKKFSRWEVVNVFGLDTYDLTPIWLGTSYAKEGETNVDVRKRFGDKAGLHKNLAITLPWKNR